ncbi:hypothetical protein SAMN05444267_1005163 [Chryseobacterium polytrichastri]|uniref:Uncharacterized protein n=1 Tax=Chryseobacterium polytrichastri TaxID=1302687 RepID=A0A1M6TPQ2_9FLAO|nr:hypothetical protein SAMN05444267_1005163 [Chryseobacterium polytrichastri]
MSKLLDSINMLSEEVKSFPIGQCSPSDNQDMQIAYLFSFKDLTKKTKIIENRLFRIS